MSARSWIHRPNWSALMPEGVTDLDRALVTITESGLGPGGDWVVDVQAPFEACGRHRGEQVWTYATRDDAVEQVDRWFATGDRIAADELARNARAG